MKVQELLRNFYLFRDVTRDDLAVVAALVERRWCGPDELIFREGDPAQAMYLVELGTVDIVTATGTVLETVGSGGEVGELAFFDQSPRAATARAREASYILSIPFPSLARTLEQHPPFAAIFYRNACAFLAKRLRRTLVDLSFARELNERHF
jgi:CRP/FNR family transcriptional regulator, cyclic AMP receptor protein